LSTYNQEIAKEFYRVFEEEPKKVEKWLRWADTALKSLGKEIPIGFKDADDFVKDIIVKTIDGDRNWDYKTLPINVFVYNTIRSEVYNAKSNEKRRRYITIDNERDAEYEIADIDEIQESAKTEKDFGNPDFVTEIENKDLLDLISAAIEEDYECSVLLEAMKEMDFNKNKALAEVTGYPVEKIENIKKKLFRKINKTVAKF